METYANIGDSEVFKIFRRKLPWLAKNCVDTLLDAVEDPHAVGILIQPKHGKLIAPLIGQDDDYPEHEFEKEFKSFMAFLDAQVMASAKDKRVHPIMTRMWYKTIAADVVVKELNRIPKHAGGSVTSPWQIPCNVLRLFNYLDSVDLAQRAVQASDTSCRSLIPARYASYHDLLNSQLISFALKTIGNITAPLNWALITLNRHRAPLSHTVH